MQVVRTYKKGCEWCAATGSIGNPNPTNINTRITCPVCDGRKIIDVVETFNTEAIVTKGTVLINGRYQNCNIIIDKDGQKTT